MEEFICSQCGAGFQREFKPGAKPRYCAECNVARRRESRKRWTDANPDGAKKAQRRYYITNREECLRRIAEWQEDNPERRAAWLKSWRHANRDKRGEQQKRWRKENPEAFAAIQRRARLKGEYGITVEQYDEMLDFQGYCCAICGKHECPTGRRLAVDADHSDKGKPRRPGPPLRQLQPRDRATRPRPRDVAPSRPIPREPPSPRSPKPFRRTRGPVTTPRCAPCPLPVRWRTGR